MGDRGRTNRTVLVSGASVAGPALALCLARHGFAVTVVEQAPALRAGGQAVDFRGAQIDALRGLGVLAEVRRNETRMGVQRFIDARGRTRLVMPSQAFSGEVEILRGDLSRVLYEASAQDAEYVFGDRITSLTETPGGVQVTFAHGAPREFDLVLGADGLHSGVRALAFGPERNFRTDRGFHVAVFSVPNHLNLDHEAVHFNVPGRGVMLASKDHNAAAIAGFTFAADSLEVDRRDDAAIRALLAERFAGLGWEVPALLDAMWQAEDLYFDSLCSVSLPSFSTGRVALVGDAGWGAGPGGSGTGLAVLAANVLAGELAAANGEHRVAFERYERIVRPAAEAGRKQARGTGPFLAPRTRRGIWARNAFHRMLVLPPYTRLFERMVNQAANTLPFTEYPVSEVRARH